MDMERMGRCWLVCKLIGGNNIYNYDPTQGSITTWAGRKRWVNPSANFIASS